MTFLRIGAVLFAAFVLTACGGSPIGGSPTSPTNTGTLAVMLKDKPSDDARAALVTFSGVTAHRDGGDSVSLPFADGKATRTCDLKKLVGVEDFLGTGPLEPGHYTQLRLTVSRATLNFGNPSSGPPCAATIVPPPGGNLVIDVSPETVILNGEFDVTANQTTTITLDFDAEQSILRTADGIYRMTPVVRIVGVR